MAQAPRAGCTGSAPDPSTPPWLSVLIPAHNAALHLEDCVRSVLGQAGPGVETIVFDDASTDGSREVLRRLKQSNPCSLEVLQVDRNLGVSGARNALLAHARGEYVWFVDADDVLQRGAIRELRRIVERAAPDLVLCDHRAFRAPASLVGRLRGQPRRRTFDGAAHRRCEEADALAAGVLRCGQLHVWSKIARRPLWPPAPFPAVRHYEDISATARLLVRARSWYYMPEAWVLYRQHGSSLTRAAPVDRLSDLVAALDDLRATLAPVVATSPAVRFALDYFELRSFAAIARRLRRSSEAGGGPLGARCRNAFEARFPQGASAVIAGCIARGWWLRAWRIARALKAAGWQ